MMRNLLLSFILLILAGFGQAFSSDINQNNAEEDQTQAQPLNSNEIGMLSKVISTSQERPLTDQDLESFRAVMKSYVGRTGNYISNNEINGVINSINEGNDYQYELGRSLLFSWDNHQHFTSKRFDELYLEMQQEGVRKQELLQKDKDSIQAAAENKPYVEGADGRKFELSREIILQGLTNVEITKENIAKIIAIEKEFVK